MILHRLATIALGSAQLNKEMTVEGGPVTLEIRRVNVRGAPASFSLAIASIPVETLYLDDARNIIVPEEARHLCELEIRLCADLLSVCSRLPRKVASPPPFVALSGLSVEERSMLDDSNGFHIPRRATAFPADAIDFTDKRILEAIRDRAYGVSLLAEVNSTESSLGKYRELIRFFEHAFAVPVASLRKKLAQCLVAGDLGYSRQEVRAWLEHRHGAIHGDFQRTTHLVTEVEVLGLLPRMQQAAYDVLLNKKVWHSPSRERRRAYPLRCATTSADGLSLRLTRGEEARFTFLSTDPWGVFPVNFGADLRPAPEGWWTEPRAEGDTDLQGGAEERGTPQE